MQTQHIQRKKYRPKAISTKPTQDQQTQRKIKTPNERSANTTLRGQDPKIKRKISKPKAGSANPTENGQR